MVRALVTAGEARSLGKPNIFRLVEVNSPRRKFFVDIKPDRRNPDG